MDFKILIFDFDFGEWLAGGYMQGRFTIKLNHFIERLFLTLYHICKCYISLDEILSFYCKSLNLNTLLLTTLSCLAKAMATQVAAPHWWIASGLMFLGRDYTVQDCLSQDRPWP